MGTEEAYALTYKWGNFAMTQGIRNNVKQIAIVLFGSLLLWSVMALITPSPTQAAVDGCSNLPSDKGLAKHTENGVGSGEYTIFARVKVASGPATFDLSIDGSGGQLCDLQVSKDGSNGNWVWYSSGSKKLNWTGGDMRFQMSGDKSGVGLDCVVLFDLTQGSFSPSTKEDCNPTASGTSTTATGATTATAATGAATGCIPVGLSIAGPVVSSFLTGVLQDSAKQFDANNDGKITLAEAGPIVSKFLKKQCL